MNDTTAGPLTADELARAAELAPAAIRETRKAFLPVARLADEYYRAGYRSLGRKVINLNANR